MNKYRKLTLIMMIITFVVEFIGMALMHTNLVVAFIILIAGIVPAYASHVLDRLDEDERQY